MWEIKIMFKRNDGGRPKTVHFILGGAGLPNHILPQAKVDISGSRFSPSSTILQVKTGSVATTFYDKRCHYSLSNPKKWPFLGKKTIISKCYG